MSKLEIEGCWSIKQKQESAARQEKCSELTAVLYLLGLGKCQSLKLRSE